MSYLQIYYIYHDCHKLAINKMILRNALQWRVFCPSAPRMATFASRMLFLTTTETTGDNICRMEDGDVVLQLSPVVSIVV